MTTSTPAGWYDDPEDSNAQRYWDGQGWTPHRQRKSVSTPPPPPPPSLAPPSPPSPSPGLPPPAPNQLVSQQVSSYQPTGSTTRKRSPVLLVGIVLAVVLLGGGGFFAYKEFMKKSPEDEIRSAVQHVFGDYNANQFTHDAAWQCKANAGTDNSMVKEGRDLRAQTGTVSASVANIHVSGDKATADVTVTFEKVPGQGKTMPMQFVKEDGRWKECTPPVSDSSGDGG